MTWLWILSNHPPALTASSLFHQSSYSEKSKKGNLDDWNYRVEVVLICRLLLWKSLDSFVPEKCGNTLSVLYEVPCFNKRAKLISHFVWNDRVVLDPLTLVLRSWVRNYLRTCHIVCGENLPAPYNSGQKESWGVVTIEERPGSHCSISRWWERRGKDRNHGHFKVPMMIGRNISCLLIWSFHCLHQIHLDFMCRNNKCSSISFAASVLP